MEINSELNDVQQIEEVNRILDGHINDDTLSQKIKKIYEDSVLKFTESLSSQDKKEDEWNDLAGMVIDAANEKVLDALREYAMDAQAHPYETPLKNIIKLKRYYARILERKNNDKLTNEIFGTLFRVLYGAPMENAIAHRKEVLSQNKP